MKPLCDKRRKMVEDNMKLAYYFASSYMKHFNISESHRSELGSCAIIGLIKATERYDPKKGKLVTWAWHYMRNELDQYRMGLWVWPLKGPSGRAGRVYERVGPRRFYAVPLMKDGRACYGEEGVETVDREEVSFEIMDNILRRDLLKFMYRLIETALTPRESKIIKLRLGGKSLTWIGEHLGLCKERIRQIEAASTKKMKLHARTLAPA